MLPCFRCLFLFLVSVLIRRICIQKIKPKLVNFSFFCFFFGTESVVKEQKVKEERKKEKMVETGNHNHNHNHQPPPQQPPPGPALPLGAARGPAFPPSEQLLQLHYCIHSNPSWREWFSSCL